MTMTAVDKKQYEKYLKVARKYVCKGVTRPVLQGVYHHADGSLIATDATRLIRITNAHSEEAGLLLDKTGLHIHGQYPDVSRVTPKSCKLELTDVSVKEWLDGHELADIIARENGEQVNKRKFVSNHLVTLQVASGHPILLVAECSDGNLNHKFDVAAPQGTGRLTIHYNATFMIEAMKALKTLGHKTCSIQFTGEMTPILIVSDNVTILLMPIKKPEKK